MEPGLQCRLGMGPEKVFLSVVRFRLLPSEREREGRREDANCLSSLLLHVCCLCVNAVLLRLAYSAEFSGGCGWLNRLAYVDEVPRRC